MHPNGFPRPADEVQREAAVLRSGALFATADRRLDAIAERARVRFGTAMAALTIIHSTWQHVIAAVGTTPGTFPRSESFCGYTILDPTSVFCVEDASTDPRFRDNPNVIGNDRVRFYAGAPLVSGGQPLGALCILDPVPRVCPDAAGQAEFRVMAAEAVDTLLLVGRAGRG